MQPFRRASRFWVHVVVSVGACLGLAGCSSSGEGVPDAAHIPEGVEIVELALDESESGTLPSGGRLFSVTVTLNMDVPTGDYCTVCFVVRDSELVRGRPLAAGFVGLSAGEGKTAVRRDGVFQMVCDDGEVAGRAISDAYGMDDYDRSSGERSTRIFVQHLEGLKSFPPLDWFGWDDTVGVKGVKSNRITVSCD